MVKVAVSGANSALALEVIDQIVKDGTHDVLALVRKDPSQFPEQAGIKWAQVSFSVKEELVQHFRGVEVVLNFIVVNDDPDNKVGKLLIDAAVEAGVRRFAPSEWAMSQGLYDIIDNLPWYHSKLAIQRYLREINQEKKVIEYSFFQPGIFMEYLLAPHQVAKHVPGLAGPFQLNDLRIATIKGYEDAPVVFTSAVDIGGVVRRAIEYPGEWPEVGGITGDRLSARQIQAIVERVRGEKVELVLAEEEDLKAGILKVNMPVPNHPSIPEDMRAAIHDPLWTGYLYGIAKGAWTVTDEWNKLLPDYKFTKVENYVNKVWGEDGAL